MFVLKERRERARESVCAWSGYSFAVVAAREKKKKRGGGKRERGESKGNHLQCVCVCKSAWKVQLLLCVCRESSSLLSDVFYCLHLPFYSLEDDIKFLSNMMMINSSPSPSSTGADSSKRLRLTIPRNSKTDHLTTSSSNTHSPHKFDEKTTPTAKKSIDCNNTMTTMKQQLSTSIDNENDTTLLTTTTTTTTVEVKVKTTKTSSSSSRKRKLHLVDDTLTTADDNLNKQEQEQDEEEEDEEGKQQQTLSPPPPPSLPAEQSVSKKKVIYLSRDIFCIEYNWSAKDRKEIQSLFLLCARARARHPRGIMISWCVRVCVCVRPIYFSLCIHTRSMCVCMQLLYFFFVVVFSLSCPMSVCYSSLSSYNTYLKETE